MPGYIFLPIPTPEMQEFADDWNQGRADKGKPPYGVLRNRFASGRGKGITRAVGLGALRAVNAGDKLYVLCHGNSLGSAAVGAKRGAKRQGLGWTGGTMKKYDADELADVLEAEGLTKQFADLRVFACGSAVTPTGATAPFAQGLASAMRARGYAAIRVSGYEGALKSSYSNRRIPPGSTKYAQHPHAIDPTTATEHKGVQIGDEFFPPSTRRVSY